MFFIVPNSTTSTQSSTVIPPSSSTESASKRKRVTTEPEEVASYYPKRTPKACDRCRLKKARCTGGQLCERCKHDGVVCVTSRDSKRPALPQNPGYVHLVESQRDQLVQALCQILQSEDTPDSSRLKSILADLGIATESLHLQPCPDSTPGEAPAISNQPFSRSWNDMFNDLDGHQIQLIESFCATTPQTQDILMAPYLEMDCQDNSFQQVDPRGLFQHREPGDFTDLCSWSQDVTLPDHYGTWEVNEDRPGNNSSSKLPFDGSLLPNVYNNGNAL